MRSHMSFTMRLFRIDQMIQEAGVVGFETLRTTLQCSAPTLKRDLRYMREQLGAPIVYSAAKGGYCYSDDSKGTARQIEKSQEKLPSAWYSANEMRVLMTILEELGEIESDKRAVLASDMRALRARLLACVRGDKISARDLLRRVKVVLEEHVHVELPFFDVVGEALGKRRRLRITYYTRSRGAENAREISTLRLVNYRSHWYVDAWCHQVEGLRTFNIENILSAEILTKKCRVVAMRTVQETLDKSYGIFSGGELKHAVIEIDSVMTPYVGSEIWHKDQQTRRHSDGSMTLEVPYSSEIELAGRVLSLGSHARVASPESLRSYVMDELKSMAAGYGMTATTEAGGRDGGEA